MTEDEAKTKWCPFARIFGAGDYWQSTNGRDPLKGFTDELTPITRCIGSECMAWRPKMEFRAGLGVTGNPALDAELAPTNQGYCGLAGKP